MWRLNDALSGDGRNFFRAATSALSECSGGEQKVGEQQGYEEAGGSAVSCMWCHFDVSFLRAGTWNPGSN
jgi:hypothetical protein